MKKSLNIFSKVTFFVFILCFGVLASGFHPAERESSPLCNDCYELPIIMYHATHRKNPGKYNVTPALLDEDFRYLKAKGYTAIFVEDLVSFCELGTPLPKKPIMITFDDGYTNNYTSAFPVIKKNEIKCIISVVGKYIDDNYKDNVLCETKSHLTYEQIKEIYDSGYVEIQSHTYNLHNTKKRSAMAKKKYESYEDYEKVLTNDLLKLHNNLLEKTGITCTAVAYPFGKFTKNDTEKILRKLGFKAAFTCREGINTINKDSNLFYLKRFNRPYGKSSKNFFKCIEKAA